MNDPSIIATTTALVLAFCWWIFWCISSFSAIFIKFICCVFEKLCYSKNSSCQLFNLISSSKKINFELFFNWFSNLYFKPKSSQFLEQKKSLNFILEPFFLYFAFVTFASIVSAVKECPNGSYGELSQQFSLFPFFSRIFSNLYNFSVKFRSISESILKRFWIFLLWFCSKESVPNFRIFLDLIRSQNSLSTRLLTVNLSSYSFLHDVNFWQKTNWFLAFPWKLLLPLLDFDGFVDSGREFRI